jgi:hypothetical protein
VGSPGAEEIQQLADHEIDYAIDMIPEFSSIFGSPVVDKESLGVQRESDFYLGMAWATITCEFTSQVATMYNRPANVEEAEILVSRIMYRTAEIKKAISDLGI